MKSKVETHHSYEGKKVTLPCGYNQRFWVEESDGDLIKRCKRMKSEGVETN